jgi:hypothetical protein
VRRTKRAFEQTHFQGLSPFDRISQQKLKLLLASKNVSFLSNRHENINKLYTVFEDAKRVTLILEYCSRGDVFKLLAEWKGHMDEETVVLRVRAAVFSFFRRKGARTCFPWYNSSAEFCGP